MSNNDKIITGKLIIVKAYSMQLSGKTFGPNHPGGRNKMAMALMFDTYKKMFIQFVNNECDNPLTPDQELLSIKKLDHIICLFETSDETWDLFWEGKQPIKPDKLLFNEFGRENIKPINLFELKSITI